MVFWKKKKEEEPEVVEDYYGENFPDDNLPAEYDRSTAATLVDHVLLNRPLKAVLAILLIAVVTPAILYSVMYGVEPPPEPFGTCVVLQDFWSDCVPGRNVVETECVKVGCCWNSTLSTCYHSVPSRQTYTLKDANSDPEKVASELVPRMPTTPFNLSALPVFLSVVALSQWQVSVKMTSTPHDLPTNTIPLEQSEIRVDMKNLTDGFWLTLWRRKSGTVLFSTENGPLIASDGYWELSLQFSDQDTVFGAGSAGRGKLKISSGNTTIYASSRSVTNGRQFIMCVQKNGTSHGIIFESPGALEIVGRPSNLVTIRSTAKERLNMQVFIGETPAEVIQHVTDFTKRPKMPPSWAFGVHVCRDAARNESGNSTMEFYDTAFGLKFPYDSDCIDESAFGNESFTQQRLDDMNTNLNFLKSKNITYILSLFPQVTNDSLAFNDSVAQNLLLKMNDTIFLGLHREQTVGFPDYTSEEVQSWLLDHLGTMLEGLAVSPAGLVLPENWPNNEDEELDDGPTNLPPYVPQALEGSLSNGTVWWKAVHKDGSLHQTKHAHYGSKHAEQVTKALSTILKNNSLPLLVHTASKLNGEATWLGEEQPATWDGLKRSLLSVLEAGLSGEAFSGGGAVCSSRGDWNEALCTRWSLLAFAAFPTVRYHHAWGESPRDPSNMSNNTARIVAQAARLRYQLLPYFYTLAYEAITTGLPLARPMFLEFPKDNGTWSLDEQLMLGPALLIAPVLRPADVAVDVYLPKPAVAWYHLQGGEQVQRANFSGNVTILVGDSELVMLLRAGHILVMQEDEWILDSGWMTTSDALLSNRRMIMALNCAANTTESNCTATGTLYLDNGISTKTLILTGDEYSLTVPGIKGSDVCDDLSSIIAEVMVYGVPGNVTEPVTVNDKTQTAAILNFSPTVGRLKITNLDVDWCTYTSDIIISWSWAT